MELVNSIDIYGASTEGIDKHQYRALNGAILNWWPKTGTIYFQGPDQAGDQSRIFGYVGWDDAAHYKADHEAF